ncbi:MAG: thioredoxin-dependent thiol peroxidase [Gammaproteobacteria bacterium]
MSLLEVGDPAPEFAVADQSGQPLSLSSLRGRKVVLYFYPKDDTPGCTKEACGIRDHFPAFGKLNAEVLGVSVDDAESHRKFIAKYRLPFTLLADTDKDIVQAYGVWGEKNRYGRKYMGVNRVTYVIDEHGNIAAVFPKVKPEGHAEELLAVLRGEGRP